MSKPPKRRLKVFQAPFGFYDTVVAASSRAAALRAWGTHQNLFASGQAREIDDPAAVKIALAHPETVLKRAVGSGEPFALEATSLPKVPPAKKPPVLKTAPKSKATPSAPKKPPADRRALEAAELALRDLDTTRKGEEALLRERQDELDAAKAAAQAAYVAARKAATAAVVKAREAFRKAGGTG